jgi:serine/threonine protein kinase
VFDIYSAGLSLYQLLVGFDPFVRATEAETIAAVKARDYKRIREVAPHTPRVLAMRVEKAMADKPLDRYQSATEFHDALGELKVFPVAWSPRTPHPAHQQCWHGRHRGPGQDLSICVMVDGTGFKYETRKAGGSQQRVLDGCGIATDGQKLGVALRRVFDKLS